MLLQEMCGRTSSCRTRGWVLKGSMMLMFSQAYCVRGLPVKLFVITGNDGTVKPS